MKHNPLTFLTAHPDRISGITLCVAGLFLLRTAARLPFGKLSAPDAGFFPISLAVLLLLAAVVLVARSLRAAPAALDFTPRSWGVAIAVLALFLYGVLVNRIGFLICTIAILFLLMNTHGRLGWKLSLLLAVPSVVVTYLGFIELGVPLPSGLLGFF